MDGIQWDFMEQFINDAGSVRPEEETNIVKLDARLFIEVGSELLEEGYYDLALDALNRAIDLNPFNSAAFNSSGIIYGELEDYEKSSDDFTRAIELDERYSCAYCNRGLNFYRQGSLREALADYDKAIKLDPFNPEFYYNRGFLYYAEYDFIKAFWDFTRAFKLSEDDECEDDELRSVMLIMRSEILIRLLGGVIASLNFDPALISNLNNPGAFMTMMAEKRWERMVLPIRDASINN